MSICVTQDGTCIIVDEDTGIVIYKPTRQEAERELARRKAARKAA